MSVMMDGWLCCLCSLAECGVYVGSMAVLAKVAAWLCWQCWLWFHDGWMAMMAMLFNWLFRLFAGWLCPLDSYTCYANWLAYL